MHTTDLADLQSLHTKKHSIIGSQKSVVNIHHDGPCMLNLVSVTLVDFSKQTNFTFLLSWLTVCLAFLFNAEINIVNICELQLYYYV